MSGDVWTIVITVLVVGVCELAAAPARWLGKRWPR